jgi:hypothetical protein
MGSSSSQFKLSRIFFLGCSAVVALGVACGENPELVIAGQQPVDDGAGLGETCARTGDCAYPLLCGPAKTCVEPCGDVAGDACRAEACLPSGFCSVGLGKDCTANTDCTDGLACSAVKRCSVPCQPGAKGVCKDDAVCRDDATCPTDKDIVIGTGGAGTGEGGDTNGSGGASSCIDVEVDFTPQIPTVLLLIDRSLSMTATNFGAAVKDAVDAGTYTLGDCPKDNDWRWNVVRDVLMSPTKGIVKPLEGRVRFGLSLYTSVNGRLNLSTNPPVVDPSIMCPTLINVPIALGNHQTMLDQFKCSDLGQDTPTGESLRAAADTLKGFTEPGAKVIVLATDGEPDTCDCPNFNGNVPADCKKSGKDVEVRQQVVDLAGVIHGEDVTVHVINVSTPGEAALQQHLADVADAGGGKVYPGFSPGALSDAFESIIDGARSCVVDLNGEIATGKEKSGTVSLDGSELGLDDVDGWQVNSPTQIELLGDACETIKKGGHDISIKFPCDSFKPPVH